MKVSLTNPNNCLYCGKQLSLFHLIRDTLYCKNAHRSAHLREVNQLALARLQSEHTMKVVGRRVGSGSIDRRRWEPAEAVVVSD